MAERRRISLRMLIVTVGGVAIVPLCVLLWAGWRLRERELALASQQVNQQVERAADIVTATLQRSVGTSRQRLEARGTDWPEGAVVIETTPSRLNVWPRARFAWVPEPPILSQASAATFAEAEDLEFRKGDLAAAESLYRRLFGASDPATRAAAAIRLARVLRARNQTTGALAIYAAMERMDQVGIEGVPAALVGAHARSELLAESGRHTEAVHAFATLQDNLKSGRWPLSRPVYALYAGASGNDAAERQREAFSQVVSRLHDQGKLRALDNSGFVVQLAGRDYTVLQQPTANGTRTLIVTPEFVESQWLKPARVTAAAQKVRLSIGGIAANPAGVVRRPVDTSLPWTVQVESLDRAALLAGLTERQRLLDAGFILLALFTLAAAAIAIRALLREWEASELQSAFVSAVSHEFRTPLTSLRQFTEMLRDGREMTEERRRVCYDAQARAADRLTRLVESLLDFSRLESGSRPYRLERCEAGPLVLNVVRDFNNEIGAEGRKVELTQNGSALVDVDAEALSLVLWNLLDNAFKYSPGEKNVDVAVERQNGHLAIRVRDRGLGIPLSEQRVIFGRFRRGAQASTLGIKGTGIGLALVDHIVKAHQGTIELESESGKGSCFTVLIPVKE